MGAHRLQDTAIGGKDEILATIPQFDLHFLRRVVKLQLIQADADISPDEYALVIEAEQENVRGANVVLEFSGVRTVTLPRLMPSFYFGELEIDDVSSEQLEGVRFRAEDHGMTEFEVLCKGVTIRLRIPNGTA